MNDDGNESQTYEQDIIAMCDEAGKVLKCDIRISVSPLAERKCLVRSSQAATVVYRLLCKIVNETPEFPIVLKVSGSACDTPFLACGHMVKGELRILLITEGEASGRQPITFGQNRIATPVPK